MPQETKLQRKNFPSLFCLCHISANISEGETKEAFMHKRVCGCHLMVLIDISRPVYQGHPDFLQPSLGQRLWSTPRPSESTGGHLAWLQAWTPTGSPRTARPFPLPVKALPPLLLLLNPTDQGSAPPPEARRYVSTVWRTR